MSPNVVPATDIYGPGAWVDENAGSVQEDAQHLFQLLVSSTPNFTDHKSRLESVSFEGTSEPITPGPLKANVVAAALHAMCGVVANEILDVRDGPSPDRKVSINTDHASFWLGSVGMSERNGRTVREIAKAGELAGIFEKDLEKGTFGTPIRLRATANYETKDPGVWYQLHGSLDAGPVLEAIGVDPNMQCDGPDEAYRIIGEHVKKYGANELEMINVASGLCGSINYTPEAWRKTRMSRDLSKHPLINYSRQPYAVPTPSIPLAPSPSDSRPLAGIKVVEVVRIIAGPVIGTTLAAMGADVVRVNCSHLPDFNVSICRLRASLRFSPFRHSLAALRANSGISVVSAACVERWRPDRRYRLQQTRGARPSEEACPRCRRLRSRLQARRHRQEGPWAPRPRRNGR